MKKDLRGTRLLWLVIGFGFALATMLFACSKPDNDDCAQKKQEITEYYANQIQYVNDHPGPRGIDYTQIGLLQQERDKKLSEACN